MKKNSKPYKASITQGMKCKTVWLFHTLYCVNVSNLCDHRIRGDSDGTLCIVNDYYQTDVSIRPAQDFCMSIKIRGL